MNKVTFIAEDIGDGVATACLLSYRAVLDGRPVSDEHPSEMVRGTGIVINDGLWWASDAERTKVLLPLALDERLSAWHCDASPAAERARTEICAHWTLSVAAPMALEAAAARLCESFPEGAEKIAGYAAKLRAVSKACRASWIDINRASDATCAAAAHTSAIATYLSSPVSLSLSHAIVNAAADVASAVDDCYKHDVDLDADATPATAQLARAAYQLGANILPELLNLFDRLLEVRTGIYRP